jgi:dTDP-4-amino-4,6-dideoxygalactose transaminase
MKILFNDLGKQWLEIKDSAMESLKDFFDSGFYIDGKYLHLFEDNFAKYTKSKYALGVSNGTDALKLAIQAFEFKDNVDVIIPANTYIADILAIEHQPKNININFNTTLIDCDDYYQLDLNLLEIYLKNNRHKYKNCLIIAVHLYGHPIDMIKLEKIAKEFDCKILEDASQAHGAFQNNEMIGKRSDITAYSCYPGKNLGAIGDAGIITTNDDNLYDKIKHIRNFGSSKKYHYEYIGHNNRLDPIQAIFLNEKLNLLDTWNEKRLHVANLYNNLLDGIEQVIVPKTANYVNKHVQHVYCLRVMDRENLQKHLNNFNIPTIIHYPIPIQLTKPFMHLNEKFKNNHNTLNWCNNLLSLPMHQYMERDEIYFISNAIKSFYNK